MKFFLWFSREFQGLHRWIADPIGHRRTRNGSSRPGVLWQITSLNSMHQYHELYFFFLMARPKQWIFVILLHRYPGAVNTCKTIKFVFPCYFLFFFSISRSIFMHSSILGKTVDVLVPISLAKALWHLLAMILSQNFTSLSLLQSDCRHHSLVSH